jgi:hypothetical protein
MYLTPQTPPGSRDSEEFPAMASSSKSRNRPLSVSHCESNRQFPLLGLPLRLGLPRALTMREAILAPLDLLFPRILHFLHPVLSFHYRPVWMA